MTNSLIGQNLLHYRLTAKLGEGGMGVVYKARDTQLDRNVAIKFLPANITRQSNERERFLIEARAAAALNHPNIATVYAIEEHDDDMFIVMEFIDGKELRDIVNIPLNPPSKGDFSGSPFEGGQEDVLAIATVLTYASQIAAGLQAAHEKGIIHRDIKSSNIMVTESRQVKIMDFGLAKISGTHITKSNAMLGTVAYMSPEQLQNLPVDHRSDIWSFGVVLYEMLTGKLPFRGDIDQAVMYAIVNEAQESVTKLRTDIPAALEAIVDGCLEKEPGDRYQQMDELLADLKSCQRGSDITSWRPARQWKHVRKQRTRLIAGITALLALLLAVLSLSWLSRDFERPPVSIAVLPLEKITPETEQWILDSVHGELINALQNIGGFRVISRSTMMALDDASKTIPEVAGEIDVSHIIEAEASRIGNELKISVRLVDASKDEVLWSKSFVRDFENFHVLQSEIALGIAEETHVKLTPGEVSRLAESKAVPEQAIEAYLRGRFEWAKRTNESLEQAIAYFNQAIAIEPAYSKAYAGMADTYIWAGIGYANFISRDSSFALARENALKALAIDSALAEAYVPLAQYRWRFERNRSEAEKLLQRAIALNPSYATAYEYYGAFFLMDERRFDEAMAALRKAESLDPLSLSIKLGIGWIFERSKEYDKAIAQYQSIIEMDPSFFMGYYNLGFVYNVIGRSDQAVPVLEKAHSINATFFVKSQLGYAYAKSDNHTRAVEICDELLQAYEQGNIGAAPIAWIYLGLGDHDEALTWLEKGAERKGGFKAYNNFIHSPWDVVRSNPRFVKLFENTRASK